MMDKSNVTAWNFNMPLPLSQHPSLFLHFYHPSLSLKLPPPAAASAQGSGIIMICKTKFVMGVKVTPSNLSPPLLLLLLHCYAWSSTPPCVMAAILAETHKTLTDKRC